MSASAGRMVLASNFLRSHPQASAKLLEKFDASEVVDLVSGQPPRQAAQVLSHMVPQRLAGVLQRLDAEQLLAIATEMASPNVAAALRWLAPEDSERLLSGLPAYYQREVGDQLTYPADSAGSLMDPRVVVVRPDDTVRQAISVLKDIKTPIFQVYAVDEDGKILGAIALQRLAGADPVALVKDLVESTEPGLDAFSSRDEVAAFLRDTALPSIAVLDAEKRLVGVLRARTLLGVAEDVVSVNLQRMVGASKDEQALSSVGFAVKKRLPWLNINLLTAFLAAAVVGLFESTISQVTSLAILLPVVAGQSGNSGSQALAVTMRGLAIREIRTSHWFRVALKETLVGIVNGIAIAVVTGAGVYVWSGSWALSVVISTSMVLAMAAAGLAGASIPIVLKRLGLDPAVSSSIILTTVTDVTGFFGFLGLATLMMAYLV